MFRLLLLTLIFSFTLQVPYSFALDKAKAPKHLKWSTRTIKLFVSSSLFGSNPAIKPEGDVNGALLNALQRWEEAANIEFKIAISDAGSISPPGHAGDGVSLITIASDTENMLAFSQKSENTSGLTRVFYDSRGTITEADIALNPTQLFSTDKTPGTFDLEAVLTHEIGHLLGLYHSADAASVMFEGVGRNGGSEPLGFARPLSADDKSKIRRLYGADAPFDNCCGKVKVQLAGSQVISNSHVVWIQETRTGALVEVISTRNRSFEFGPLARGNYAVVAQSAALKDQIIAAENSLVTYVQGYQNVTLPPILKPVTFDLQTIGVNGDLSERAANVFPGNTYRLVIAGPGLDQLDLQFGTTSSEIVLYPIRSEGWAASKSMASRSFQMTVPRSIRPGQYSVFAEDQSGLRRYLVGGISVN